MQINKIYCGDAKDLLSEIDIKPQLIILSPPDINETDFSLDEYKKFIKEIYTKAADILDEGGVLFSCTTDTKIKSKIFLKHTEITNCLSGKLDLFNYKVWAKSLKTNLYILNFTHMLFFRKGKLRVNNKIPEFFPDVWLLEVDKLKWYKNKDSFPSELIRRVIVKFTNKDDVVLDPFIGSGKTGKVALENSRNFIGFDIEPEFVRLASENIFK